MPDETQQDMGAFVRAVVASADPWRTEKARNGMPVSYTAANSEIAALVLRATADYLRYVDWQEVTAADALDELAAHLVEAA